MRILKANKLTKQVKMELVILLRNSKIPSHGHGLLHHVLYFDSFMNLFLPIEWQESYCESNQSFTAFCDLYKIIKLNEIHTYVHS